LVAATILAHLSGGVAPDRSSREDTHEGSRIHQVEHLLVSPADLPTPEAGTVDPRTSSPESGAGCTAWLSRL